MDDDGGREANEKDKLLPNKTIDVLQPRLFLTLALEGEDETIIATGHRSILV